MNRFTRGLAMASARHPWRTFASWVLALVAVVALASSAGGEFMDDFSSPGSQSAKALELLNENFPEAAKGSALVVLEATEGTTLQDHRDGVAAVVADVAALEMDAGRRDALDQRARRRLGNVDERHAAVLAGERAHERRPDARAAAGDEHRASREIGVACLQGLGPPPGDATRFAVRTCRPASVRRVRAGLAGQVVYIIYIT